MIFIYKGKKGKKSGILFNWVLGILAHGGKGKN
jgi:hypothetical protein